MPFDLHNIFQPKLISAHKHTDSYLFPILQASTVHYGDWGDGADFDPVVKTACESFKNASKNV